MTSQDIRSRKRPYLGARNILTEHSFSENAGDDMVTSISDYNKYTSDFEQENLIRPFGISPDTSYRYSSYNTLVEDVGESLPDPPLLDIDYDQLPPHKKRDPNSGHFGGGELESFNNPSGISSPWLMVLIFIIVIVSIYIIYYYINEKNKTKEVEREARSVIEYNNMMNELP